MRSLKQVAAGMGTPRTVEHADPYAGGYFTKHGWFSYADVEALGGRENYDGNGEMYIQFPVNVNPTMGPQYRDIPSTTVDEHAKEGAQS